MRYFERELAYVRKSLSEFAQSNPEQANTLKLNQSSNEDPNISRLIDGMALLTAKTEKKFDEQFPELLQDLFNILYPGYLQISPSYAPITLNEDLEKLSESVFLEKGAQLSATLKEGEECFFSTVSDLQIDPYYIKNIRAESAPFNFITPNNLKQADSVVQIELLCADPDSTFSQLDLTHFDFYVRGFENNSKGLIDLLLLNTEVISIVSSEGKQIEISPSRLNSRITDPDFQWLPKYGNHFSGFDLLRDYFVYPDKAAYFRIDDFGKDLTSFESSTVTINFFIKHLPVEFLRLFDSRVFRLNTVPAINLFERRGEPVKYDFSQLSVPVIADLHAVNEMTVVAVDKVFEVLPTGEIELSPVYEGGYWYDESQPQWQARQMWTEKGKRKVSLSLSFVDVGQMQNSVLLSMQIQACNGRLPCLLPAKHPVELLDAIDLPGELSLLSTPTAPQYPNLDNQLNWRFIALINANFSSLTQSDNPVKVLQESLRMCAPGRVCPQADSIKQVTYQHIVAPMKIKKQSVFASGTIVTIMIDDGMLASNIAVFGAVLNLYLQQFCSFDRFIQLKIKRFGNDTASIEYDKVHGSQLCL